METEPEHRSFRLTDRLETGRQENDAPAASEAGKLPQRAAEPVRQIWRTQLGLAIVWFLLWNMILCLGAANTALWLPLNYLLLDVYLLLSDGATGPSWDRSSWLARGAIRTSPVWMLVTSFVLGLVGSGLNAEVFQ